MENKKSIGRLDRQVEICNNKEKYAKIINEILKLNSSIEIINYLSKAKIDIVNFKYYIDSYIINLNNLEDKKEYNRIKNKLEEIYDIYINELNNAYRIKELIIHGIEDNGQIRNFELLDYFESTKLGLNEFLNIIIKNLSVNELRIVKRFVVENSKIIKSRQFTHVDKLSFLIDGKVESVTIEDEENAISYLKENNIPLMNATYKPAVKRYLKKRLINND